MYETYSVSKWPAILAIQLETALENQGPNKKEFQSLPDSFPIDNVNYRIKGTIMQGC